jgi:hypothetical protein
MIFSYGSLWTNSFSFRRAGGPGKEISPIDSRLLLGILTHGERGTCRAIRRYYVHSRGRSPPRSRRLHHLPSNTGSKSMRKAMSGSTRAVTAPSFVCVATRAESFGMHSRLGNQSIGGLLRSMRRSPDTLDRQTGCNASIAARGSCFVGLFVTATPDLRWSRPAREGNDAVIVS